MRATGTGRLTAVITAMITAMVAVSVLGVAGGASAQVPLGGMNLEGEVTSGTRFFLEEPSKSRAAKFEEYRDLREGLVLQELRLRLLRPDESYSVGLEGGKWGLRDQEFSLRGGRLGLWEFGFDWDQTPHIYSTNARMLAAETHRGVFELPTARPLLPAYNAGRELDEISTRWDTARLSLLLTPTPDLDLKAEYTRIHKDGDRPMGMAFGNFNHNSVELPAPIEETIHDARIGGTLAREQWQLQIGYAFSMFDNGRKSVIADNPCFGLAAAIAVGGCGFAAGGAQSAGRASLAPDNMAHTVSLAGGVNLPMRTRVNANVAYSLRLQNESFLPQTINAALAGNPALTLPQRSLNGLASTLLFIVAATNRPITPLTLSFKYRFYESDDMSNRVVFPAHALNDRALVVGLGASDPAERAPQIARRYDYTRQNADLGARWRFGHPVSLTLGGGWEAWQRNSEREVPESNEIFAKAALDVTPLDWFLARLTYRPSVRRISNYNANPAAGGVGDPQFVLMRKFDEGERDRHRADLLLQLMPTDTLTTSLTGSWWSDDYVDSPFGLRNDDSWSAGIDVTWTPAERISLLGGYVREWDFRKQRARHRPAPGADFKDFDWISNSTDTIDTFHLRGNVALLPTTLDWTFGANYSYALGRVETRNPVAPASGGAFQNALATAMRFPAFEDSLLRLETGLTYQFWKSWTASLGYVFESFQKHDWRTDGLNPFVPGVTSIWLGNDARNYAAQIVGVTIRYRIK